MAGDGWTTKRLGEVANINPDAIGRDWPHSHIRYIDISSVGVGQLEVAPQWMKLSDAPSRAKRLLRKGDTILSTVRPNRRSMFFASEPNDDWVVSTGFAVLRPNIKLVEPRFLYTCVFNQAFTEYLITREKGAAYPAVSSEDIASAEIPFPSLAEQRAIAHILGTLDDKIELNRRMNRTLEEMARAIFKSWFVDFDPVRAKMEGRWKKGESLPCLPTDLWDAFPDRLVNSELGEIPEGWEVGALNTIASLETKAVIPGDSANQLWEHFSIPAFDNGRQPVREKGESIKSGKYLVPSCCVLASKLNPQFPRVWLPDIPNPEVSICSTEFMPFVPKTESEQPFLYAFLSSEVAQAEIINRVTGSTSSRQRVKPKEIAEMPMLVPPQALRQRFSSVTRHYLARLLKNMRSITTLAAIRDTLLPKLISGELRVPDAERIVGGSV